MDSMMDKQRRIGFQQMNETLIKMYTVTIAAKIIAHLYILCKSFYGFKF